MKNNKMTSIEWLEFEINKRGPKENNPPQWLKELYEQAKAMEKEQSLKMPHYDLDALADEYANDMSCDDGTTEFDFKAGFQKALELLTFKSE